MKKVLSFFTIFTLLLVGIAFAFQTIINWKINKEKALVKFSLLAFHQKIIGNFKGVQGFIKFDSTDLDHSSADCSVDVTSINTGEDARDKYLLGNFWFDVASAPTMTFTSTKISSTSEGFLAEGYITVKRITKNIIIPFQFNGTDHLGKFTGTFTINRSDFGIGKTGSGIDDDVIINLDIPVEKSE